METWKEKLTDYEFVLWNTKRFDIESVLWVKQAFETGQYAFAADYIRLYAVYNNGGIYLDMDMEAVRPFGALLDTDYMLAYENHISGNIEAGCFGATKGHPYIKKCMEYFENKAFFDPSLLPVIMNMPKSERNAFINPLVLPEIMKNAAQEFFGTDETRIYTRDYFTAKNVVTGKIERTENTFTIHHFATQYHSEEWRKNRDTEQKIRAVFGANTVLTKIVMRLRWIVRRVRRYGLAMAGRYYIDKYILRKTDISGEKK
jgi:mannosyltransferase OCH1-like enzyme